MPYKKKKKKKSTLPQSHCVSKRRRVRGRVRRK